MYIKAFQEITKEDRGLVGGKGASLGELTNAGFAVPPGFVITTDAKNEIKEDEIFQAFEDLDSEKVSVRSSAVAEDSSSASWAGQLETYLNVTKKNLIDSIKKCWESINSERVKAYIKDQNLSEDQLQVAVVVQRMVNAKSAGVMFTVNPVSADPNEIMIESVLGLGESLVQGEITPDNFIINKSNMEIIAKDVQRIDEPSVSDEIIIKLSELGKKIEEHYGNPQDIEWAIDQENKIWILQSRPITTLS